MPKTKPNKEAEAFGRRLVKLLADWKQPRHGAGAYLAGRYKVKNVTANAWLNGEYMPSRDKVFAIAQDHGVSLEWMLFGEGEPSAPAQSPDDQELRRDLIDRRFENDVDSLRIAVATLAAVMVRHRPTEAQDAAKAIRKAVPAKFQEVGFLHELLGVLELARR